jgi:hypothetical protein
MAMRNAHFGARYVLTFSIVAKAVRVEADPNCTQIDDLDCRHFVKDELPRVAYSNPAVSIHVERKPKAKEEQWVPELVVGLGGFLLYSYPFFPLFGAPYFCLHYFVYQRL